MLDRINIEKILFLDIETVPAYPSYLEAPDDVKSFWDKKALLIRKADEKSEITYQRAGIYAEFGKIICISIGMIKNKAGKATIRIKSFFGHDEKQLLIDFLDLLNKKLKSPEFLFCAHNGKEFDFPYLSRRILINGLKLPDPLKTNGKKPWEIPHLDTLDLWRFGDYKNYSSLDLLASIFNIPSPKDDINGADIWSVYWQERDLERIAKYCQKDVLTVAQLLNSYLGKPLIEESAVSLV
jgi:DNA polymerase elongation subunit (family B)